MTILQGARRICLALVIAAAPGCAAALVGAGAAGAIAWNGRGAESTVNGTIDQNWNRAMATFQQMGIAQSDTKVENSGNERKLEGSVGNRMVTVVMRSKDNGTTFVEVTAKRSMVDYDKDYAKEVLTNIINRT
jgi:DNA-binding protein YbaB